MPSFVAASPLEAAPSGETPPSDGALPSAAMAPEGACPSPGPPSLDVACQGIVAVRSRGRLSRIASRVHRNDDRGRGARIRPRLTRRIKLAGICQPVVVYSAGHVCLRNIDSERFVIERSWVSAIRNSHLPPDSIVRVKIPGRHIQSEGDRSSRRLISPGATREARGARQSRKYHRAQSSGARAYKCTTRESGEGGRLSRLGNGFRVTHTYPSNETA